MTTNADQHQQPQRSAGSGQENTMHDLIAGALFDFMGRLTTLEDPITLSSHHEPIRLLDIFTEWAAERRLNTNNADVQHWQFHIADEYTPPVARLDGAGQGDGE